MFVYISTGNFNKDATNTQSFNHLAAQNLHQEYMPNGMNNEQTDTQKIAGQDDQNTGINSVCSFCVYLLLCIFSSFDYDFYKNQTI